ncbi:tissue-type plasminogen activator isoform X2 [Nelusetta ayraudi]|uniref:tissue-type plasminogen activator isoform X2 n=1 Tax=Nelusetta ayraudi TaxID=303726 RepID=UPI003F730C27
MRNISVLPAFLELSGLSRWMWHRPARCIIIIIIIIRPALIPQDLLPSSHPSPPPTTPLPLLPLPLCSTDSTGAPRYKPAAERSGEQISPSDQRRRRTHASAERHRESSTQEKIPTWWNLGSWRAMTRTGLIIFLSALCCSLAANVELVRSKRGTRFYRAHCVDSKTSAVRVYGDTWLRWRGPRVEYCRCALRGRELCHIVPVMNCFTSQCYNGGTCKEAVYSSDYICQCPPGFSGTRCEINTDEKCAVGQGEGYRGTWSLSHSGAQCINWNSTSLRGRRFTARKVDASSLGLGNHNFCRNPDNDSNPWCYIYRGTQVAWEFCSVPKCTEDKYQECVKDSGQSYRGTKSVTKSGSHCLPWDIPELRRKLYNAWRPDALDLGLGSHSFCRNPDGDAGPWCHIYKNMRLTWELCDMPKCSRSPAIPTTFGPRAPTTNGNGRATCGQRLDNSLNRPSYRMFGGRESDITEQPWQALINVYQPRHKQYHHKCGGVLIDSCWVLSAAHCFDEGDVNLVKVEKLEVILGRTFRKENSSSEQIFKVEKYWIHENFDSETYDNDIALLKLKTDIGICAIYSPEVLPACLPERGLVLPDWTECEISGYGKDAEFSPEFSKRIKRGYVRLWPEARCTPEVLSGRTVTSNMLCAGDTRGLDDACKGDSGGPLVCPSSGRMTLMGVISWGDGCGKKDKPGVYTRVTHYIDWINEKMRANPV